MSISRTLLSRADLIRAMGAEDDALFEYMVQQLALEKTASKTKPKQDSETADAANTHGHSAEHQATTTQESARLLDVPFWRVQQYEHTAQNSENDAITPQVAVTEWSKRPETPPPYPEIAPWSTVNTKLRQHAATARRGRHVDVGKTVKQLSRGHLLQRLPKRRQKRWGQGVQIIVDRSERLIPFWRDQDLTVMRLMRLFPHDAVEVYGVWEGLNAPLLFSENEGEINAHSPSASANLILVLSDLNSRAGMDWQHWGSVCTQAGSRIVALTPSDTQALQQRFPAWAVLPWDSAPQHRGQTGEADQHVTRLLQALAPFIRIEPGLLRAVRQDLGLPVATETHFWQHPHLSGNAPAGATWHADKALTWRQDFERLPLPQRQRILQIARAWRAHLAPEFWFEEVLGLSTETQDLPVVAQDKDEAQQFFNTLVAHNGAGTVRRGVKSWAVRMVNRVGQPQDNKKFLKVRDQLWRLAETTSPPPPGYDPANIDSTPRTQAQRVYISQQGEQLCFSRKPPTATDTGSLIGELTTADGELIIEPISPQVEDNRDPAFWPGREAPSWAHEWGWDEYGAWASFNVTDEDDNSVVQRLRWIPPGRFLMGSPESEAGRHDDEGPQHPVRLSQGFWLFDTACTQALWQAVMGHNPSRFTGKQRPVESVSWDDVQEFIAKLKQRLPGLPLSLPSEAQWEYACRAGSDTAYHFGDAITSEHARFKESETVPVTSYPANRWGLYDMHGNVDEWCLDGMREYKEEEATDPLGPLDGGSRVVRGGAWNDNARLVRAAFRGALSPEHRAYNLGFRCALVHREPGRQARPFHPQPGRAQRRTAADGLGRAKRLQLATTKTSVHCPLPATAEISLRSDTEQLQLTRITQPTWASAIGRDAFGLWTEIEVRGEQDQKVRQRLRWIAPGRFLMGSPETEHGRDDDEGPQHEVVLSEGYWLFDTPCTQALWLAVRGGENPSYFQSPQRPVERVSWEDTQQFIAALNERIPGLQLSLPTEAQWEHACRAGTRTATYAGDLEILGENNAPLLHEIAWYGGNSGQDYDLERYAESSNWPDMQFKNAKSGSREVRLKQANPWGIYDMLGNVWERCQDGKRMYSEATQLDPVGSQDGGSRVFRGGAWSYDARYVRAACRFANSPEHRDDDLGFRCALVHREPGRPVAVAAQPAKSSEGRTRQQAGQRRRGK